jgi:hypothetical protein
MTGIPTLMGLDRDANIQFDPVPRGASGLDRCPGLSAGRAYRDRPWLDRQRRDLRNHGLKPLPFVSAALAHAAGR